jgi:hypothetical protein
LIEPFHIIILGLAIATAGAIWQWRRVDPQIALLQSQVDQLRQQIASPPQAPPIQKPTKEPESKPLSPRDVQKVLEALDEISKYGEAIMWPTINNLTMWAVNWRGLVRNSNAAQLFTTSRDDLKHEVWERIDGLLSKHSKYDSILQSALALDHPTAKNETANALQACIEAMGKLPQNYPPAMDDLLEPQFKELIKQSGLLYQWEVEARRRITEMQENLKSKGVADYAKR